MCSLKLMFSEHISSIKSNILKLVITFSPQDYYSGTSGEIFLNWYENSKIP